MSRAQREARRIADQAEYVASLERAREATEEQRAQGSSMAATAGLAFGVAGLLVGRAIDRQRGGKIPPRPDQP